MRTYSLSPSLSQGKTTWPVGLPKPLARSSSMVPVMPPCALGEGCLQRGMLYEELGFLQVQVLTPEHGWQTVPTPICKSDLARLVHKLWRHRFDPLGIPKYLWLPPAIQVPDLTCPNCGQISLWDLSVYWDQQDHTGTQHIFLVQCFSCRHTLWERPEGQGKPSDHSG